MQRNKGAAALLCCSFYIKPKFHLKVHDSRRDKRRLGRPFDVPYARRRTGMRRCNGVSINMRESSKRKADRVQLPCFATSCTMKASVTTERGERCVGTAAAHPEKRGASAVPGRRSSERSDAWSRFGTIESETE